MKLQCGYIPGTQSLCYHPIKNIKFWGFHGVFPEERILGNWFIVHLEVLLSTEKNILTNFFCSIFMLV